MVYFYSSYSKRLVSLDWHSIVFYPTSKIVTHMSSVGSDHSVTSISDINISQGSSLGLLLFTLYVAPLAKVTMFFSAQHQQYANDTYHYIFTSKEELTTEIQTIEHCADCFIQWAVSHRPCA